MGSSAQPLRSIKISSSIDTALTGNCGQHREERVPKVFTFCPITTFRRLAARRISKGATAIDNCCFSRFAAQTTFWVNHIPFFNGAWLIQQNKPQKYHFFFDKSLKICAILMQVTMFVKFLLWVCINNLSCYCYIKNFAQYIDP